MRNNKKGGKYIFPPQTVKKVKKQAEIFIDLCYIKH